MRKILHCIVFLLACAPLACGPDGLLQIAGYWHTLAVHGGEHSTGELSPDEDCGLCVTLEKLRDRSAPYQHLPTEQPNTLTKSANPYAGKVAVVLKPGTTALGRASFPEPILPDTRFSGGPESPPPCV